MKWALLALVVFLLWRSRNSAATTTTTIPTSAVIPPPPVVGANLGALKFGGTYAAKQPATWSFR